MDGWMDGWMDGLMICWAGLDWGSGVGWDGMGWTGMVEFE